MITSLLFATIIAFTPTLSRNVEVPYTLRDGVLQAFDHTLRSKEIRNSEGESFVSFSESPDKRWVVIGYDEPFEKTLVWLYDRKTKAPPVIVQAKRVGKHFGVDWYGDAVFAIYWAGMGYKTSQLFQVADPGVYAQLSDIIAYDPTRDLYAYYVVDKDDKPFVIVGRAFHKKHQEERYLIELYVEDVLTASSSIEVSFGSNNITISYDGEKGPVTEAYKSLIIENARP